jgi:hypothetical protein
MSDQIELMQVGPLVELTVWDDSMGGSPSTQRLTPDEAETLAAQLVIEASKARAAAEHDAKCRQTAQDHATPLIQRRTDRYDYLDYE